MLSKHRQIIREQLDVSIEEIASLRLRTPPVKGWLRSIREALGMSGKQFGKRIGVSQPRIVQLEKDELSGAVTLRTMRQAAEGLDCMFVYALIPRTSLKETVHHQAEKVTKKRLSRTGHTMLLEDQQVSYDEQEEIFNARVAELVREMPRNLWEDE